MRNKTKIILIAFVAIFTITIVLYVLPIHKDNTCNMSFETTNPMVGQPITVDTKGLENKELHFQWCVGDQLISDINGPNYIPSEKDYENWITCTTFVENKEYGEARMYFSKLPVVYIDIDNGKTVTSKTEYLDGDMTIQGNAQFDNQYNGRIQIKGRGNSTWNCAKKPYKIKLDQKTDLFGFGKSKQYVLLANAMDDSLMRNTVASDISQKLSLTTMETTWVDVIINGEYCGNYQLCEQIRIGSNAVDIFNWEDLSKTVSDKICESNNTVLSSDDKSLLEDELNSDLNWITSGKFVYNGQKYYIPADVCIPEVTGGVLFELSAEMDEKSQFTTENNLNVMIKEPEELNTNSEFFLSMQSLWQDVENAYISADGYNSKGLHYTNYMDLDSMVSYYLTMEIMGNSDASWKSRYAYKDIDDKIKWGPVWDFDWSSGAYNDVFSSTGWSLSFSNPYCYWVNKKEFCQLLYVKYWSIRDYLTEIVEEDGRIDCYYEYLLESAEADNQTWQNEIKRGFTGDNGDVAIFKQYLKERLDWMDIQFASVDVLMQSLTSEVCTSKQK